MILRSGERVALIDSSGYLALANGRDAYHAQAVAIVRRLAQQRWQTITTNFVVAEAHALFQRRLTPRHATEFLRYFDTASTVVIRVSEEDWTRAHEIVFRYTDKTFSLTDATSFAVMERLSLHAALTFDRDFVQYGLTALQP